MAPNLRRARTAKCNFLPKKDEEMIKACKALAITSVLTNTKASSQVALRTTAASLGR